MELGEASFAQSTVFIDGTKIESVGNRYRFVWKKSVEGEIRIRHLKGIRKRLCLCMKQDRMCNGQLKPGYNVNVATVSEYVVGVYVSADRADAETTIPFMEKLRAAYPVQRVVYDFTVYIGNQTCHRYRSKNCTIKTPGKTKIRRLNYARWRYV